MTIHVMVWFCANKTTSGTFNMLKPLIFVTARYVMDPIDYFADCLYESMKGAGTDDERLMQLVVNHCEVYFTILCVHTVSNYLCRFTKQGSMKSL